MTDKPTKWYAVNTNPKCEDLVCRLLSDAGFEAFLPKLKNGKRNVFEPLFTGYLFVRFDLADPRWVNIKYMHGVRKIVGFGGAPVPVHDRIIGAIMRGVNDRDYVRQTLSLKIGDKVRFLKGPFEGLEGKFTGEVSAKQRVRVLLDAMERALTVEVEAAELVKAG